MGKRGSEHTIHIRMSITANQTEIKSNQWNYFSHWIQYIFVHITNACCIRARSLSIQASVRTYMKIGLPANSQMDLTHDIKWNEKETTKIWMVFDWSSNYYNGSHFGMANNIDKRIWNQTIITAATTTVK